LHTWVTLASLFISVLRSCFCFYLHHRSYIRDPSWQFKLQCSVSFFRGHRDVPGSPCFSRPGNLSQHSSNINICSLCFYENIYTFAVLRVMVSRWALAQT
jgi:hypothetical protein